MDHLLKDVDPARYDLVYIAGGEGIPQLLAEHRLQLARIVDAAARADRLVAAICHGPLYAGASIANFVIAARAYGLGIAALDYTPFLAADADIKRVLEVPDAFVLVNIICVGRAADEAPPIPVRPVSEVLSYERWSRGGANLPR